MTTSPSDKAQGISLLTTKIYIPPPRPDLVRRPRLIERLDHGLDLGRKLTLISAPAGFGKTTLLSEWANRRDFGELSRAVSESTNQRVGEAATTAFACLSLDVGDNDPNRFLRYTIAALQTIQAGLGEAAQAMLTSTPVPQDARDLMAEPLMPAWLYRTMGNLGWHIQARKHGTLSQLRTRGWKV